MPRQAVGAHAPAADGQARRMKFAVLPLRVKTAFWSARADSRLALDARAVEVRLGE